MNIISLEDFTRINEAILGLRRIATKEDLKQLDEDEFANVIKFLLLQSVGDGAGGLFESLDTIEHLLIESDLIEENRFETLDTELVLHEKFEVNESINEGWDDDVSTGIVATGAGAAAGVVGMAAYISFLFKKKKIKKAWTEVMDLKKEKSDLDLEAFNAKDELTITKDKELEELEPELSPKEYKEELAKIKEKKTGLEKDLKTKKEELKNFDKDQKANLKDAKDKVYKIEKDMYELDSKKYKDPDIDLKNEPEDEETPEDKTTKESLKEAEGDKPKGDDGGDDEEATGEINVLDQAIKDAKPDPDQVVKDVKAVQDKAKEDKKANTDKANKSKKDVAKAKEDAAKENKKLAKQRDDEIKKIESPEEVEALKKEQKSLKDKLDGLVNKLRDAKADVKTYSDSSGKEDIKNDIADIKEKIKPGIQDDIEEARVKAQTDPALASMKSDVKDKFKDDLAKSEERIKDQKESITTSIESATQNADNISGTSGGATDAKSLGNKALGFSKKYAQTIKAENDADLASHIASNRSKMGLDTVKQDNAEAKAKEDAKAADKDLDSSLNTVDGSDDEKKEAAAKVKTKQSEQEADDKEKKKESDAAEKENIQDKIDKATENIGKIQDRIDGGDLDDDKKKSELNKIERFKKLNATYKDQMQKLGESFTLKFNVALLETEINSMMNEYGLVLESKRKELISEEDKDKSKEKSKGKEENLKGGKSEKEETSDEDEDADGQKDPDTVAKELMDKSAKEDKDNPLVDKMVILRNMSDKDLGHLNNATGKITHSFAENEREPEGDMPRRAGEEIVYRVTLDKPKDPMYPTINVTKNFFKEAEKKQDKKIEESSSFRDKWTTALNGNS